MNHRCFTRAGLLAGLALVVLLSGLGPAAAELDKDAWKEVSKQAKRLQRQQGELAAKQQAIRRLGDDDSERAAKVLVGWATKSAKWARSKGKKTHDAAQEDLAKVEKVLLKKYPRMPPTTKADKDYWLEKKNAFDLAASHLETETLVQDEIGLALERLQDDRALAFASGKGRKSLSKEAACRPGEIGIVRAVLAKGGDAAKTLALQEAAGGDYPALRVQALDWIADQKLALGLNAALQALDASEGVVVRSAVRCLSALDDPHAVKGLIEALPGRDGLVAAEIEEALFRFTGQRFEADYKIWSRWYADHGERWLAEKSGTRHDGEGEGAKEDAYFYGIPTKSKRIVFVLDRSGSMEDKAGASSKKARGPITGGGDDDSEPHIEGDTRIEVARNQLAYSIRNLQKDVYFGVIFYSGKVESWKSAPTLVPATVANKEAAIEWFMALPAQGSTRTFDALLEALGFAVIPPDGAAPDFGAADTIFLLSDGAPTGKDADGKAIKMPADQLAEEYGRFLARNRAFKCVVHTIGIGPGHNRNLMRRIAADTGGKYKAVGE